MAYFASAWRENIRKISLCLMRLLLSHPSACPFAQLVFPSNSHLINSHLSRSKWYIVGLASVTPSALFALLILRWVIAAKILYCFPLLHSFVPRVDHHSWLSSSLKAQAMVRGTMLIAPRLIQG